MGKIYSLAPTDNADNIRKYEEYLTQVLNDEENGKKKNKNIAISGEYSSGKSSIIKTYFKNHYEGNVLYVSLASFEENGDEKIENLEKSILKQIMYKQKPRIFSNTNIKRIDENEKIIFILSLFISFCLSFLIFLKQFLELFEKIKINLSSNIYSSLLVISFLFLFFLIFIIIYYLLSHFSAFKITLSSKNLKIEEGVLNRNIDELLYFFKKTKYEIVVFEDIDRLKESVKIFSHLREINTIINTSFSKKTIIFMYEASDTLFKESENRVKFFDVIIPIIPYTTFTSSVNILCELFNDVLDDKDIVILSRFIKNSRYIYDIYNEYNILKENITPCDKDKNKRLVFLCAYKVLYPRRFNLLYKDIGVISYLLSSNFEHSLRKDILKSYKSRKDEQIKKLEQEYFKYKDKYYNEFINGIKISCKGLNFDSAIFFDSLDNIICTFKELEENHEKIEDILSKKVTLSDGVKKFFEKEIYSLKSKSFLTDKIYIDKYSSKILDLKLDNIHAYEYKFKYTNKDKVTFLKKGIDKTEYYNSSAYKDETDLDNLKYMTLNKFEEMMITNDIFKSDTKSLIVNSSNKFLKENDFNVICKIMDGEAVKENEIDNHKKVFEYLKEEYFIYDSTNITVLYEEILKSKRKKEYIKIIKNNLSESKLSFFKYLDENKINFVKEAGIINDIWFFIQDRKIDKEVLLYYIYLTVRDYTKNDIRSNSFFYFAIQNTDGIVEFFESHFDEIKDKLNKFNVVFDYFVNFNITCNEMISYIYNNNMYKIDYEKLDAIASCLLLDLKKDRVLESLYESIDKKMYERLIDNFKDTLVMLRSLGITQNDSKEFLKIIKNQIKDEEYDELLKIEKNK